MAIPASNGKTVLITGINGYIASVLGLHLLEKGYSIRGTSRRAATTEALLKGPYAPYTERVKMYSVPDMAVDGAFDDAAKGVDGIFHTASPIDFSIATYELMVTPAIRGTETVLESALKAGSQLTSVVITSSVVAIVNPKEGPYTFTEKDWAAVALETVTKNKEEGVTSPGGLLYAASKTAADRAVWKFRDEHKPSFAISTVNPSVVIGPPITLPASGSKFNETLQPLFNILSGAAETVPPSIGSGSFVDVRDVAFMHTWAYENPKKADGERYIACNGFGPSQALADILREHYKGTTIGEKIPVGTPGAGYVGYNKETGKVESVQYPPENIKVDGTKAVREMGIKYISFPQSVVDTAKALEPLV
ncbi:NAD-dependent epimerase/dehydratase:3-beta hydroxysteroid dehydrogenase/isomerase-like protein [Mollisia scopiformis]|uniref:NAD-dependent epimerase/dehydratase:3-beta hydroxysteroid dehydrogenase/isomeras-like protein n=1 Tax=Mollisia scopiformis TaxID=149040 RepID=A0A194X9R9_MOLSC|nr:NAD-dependent epimerase/dehydratase:3-beta hydroxysteroid dehydrogenase/isomerase-like protein [Mollisia scopiformis]KUJ16913.1 NAD-dependent epimerase/dehydratase:3-beta hydroxysteroid dehydrogenase/isomeras-like protein [Mollisia scopiformis]